MKELPQTPIAVEAASEGDRLWFEEHPGCERYFRPRIPGELGPLEDECPVVAFPWVEVTQIRPGFRTREPFAHLEILSMS